MLARSCHVAAEPDRRHLLRSAPVCSTQKYRELIAEAEKLHQKATAAYEKRSKAVRELQKTVKSLRSKGSLTTEEAGAATDRLEGARFVLQDIDDIRPATGSIFVRLFLGQVNVKASSARDRASLRDEYNKFKDRTNIGFVVFPLIWIFVYAYLRHVWRYTQWIHILTHVWLLYYYTSLSLRENILRVNGSNIRGWWIAHHYFSAAMSITVLTWPADSRSWDRFIPTFTAYFLYQGLVQFVQAWYQKARHYARTAMGEANPMDVAHTETLTEFHQGLYLLVVLLFIAQAWQLYNGVALFQVLFLELNVSQPWYDFREEVQCAVLGSMFIILGVLNFVVTIQTLLAKSSKERARAKLRAQDGSGVTYALNLMSGKFQRPVNAGGAGGTTPTPTIGGAGVMAAQPTPATTPVAEATVTPVAAPAPGAHTETAGNSSSAGAAAVEADGVVQSVPPASADSGGARRRKGGAGSGEGSS